jgi:hypothetical protein
MVGEKHQCKTSWMCDVIKNKSREISRRENAGRKIIMGIAIGIWMPKHVEDVMSTIKLLTAPFSICWFLSPNVLASHCHY